MATKVGESETEKCIRTSPNQIRRDGDVIVARVALLKRWFAGRTKQEAARSAASRDLADALKYFNAMRRRATIGIAYSFNTYGLTKDRSRCTL